MGARARVPGSLVEPEPPVFDTFSALRRARVVHAIRRRLRGAEPLDAWGRRSSEAATVILGTWSFVGRGYSDNDSAFMAVTTAARTREYPDAA
jgi:hypothetical protein